MFRGVLIILVVIGIVGTEESTKDITKSEDDYENGKVIVLKLLSYPKTEGQARSLDSTNLPKNEEELAKPFSRITILKPAKVDKGRSFKEEATHDETFSDKEATPIYIRKLPRHERQRAT